jgi:succinate dehydrogenase/fumarate reductase cytochrome b subunit
LSRIELANEVTTLLLLYILLTFNVNWVPTTKLMEYVFVAVVFANILMHLVFMGINGVRLIKITFFKYKYKIQKWLKNRKQIKDL